MPCTRTSGLSGADGIGPDSAHGFPSSVMGRQSSTLGSSDIARRQRRLLHVTACERPEARSIEERGKILGRMRCRPQDITLVVAVHANARIITRRRDEIVRVRHPVLREKLAGLLRRPEPFDAGIDG